MTPTQLGADRVVADHTLVGAGVYGMLTNDAARLGMRPEVRTREALRGAGCRIVRLFGPEHGLATVADDGAPVRDGRDPITGIDVVSLYGERLAPDAAQLAGLDGVIVDLPDVGARFYTYAWTMTHLLDVCASIGLPVIVLDRPNPLGGVVAEGPLLQPAYRSLLGRTSVPVRHGLTIGELARLWQREVCPALDLRVIPMAGWRRDMHWPDTGLSFVPMSPAMPSYESALLYPGTCLFEATNVGVGRGTDRPFRVLDAPWLDARALALAAAGRTPHAMELRPRSATAVELIVPAPRALQPVRAGIALLTLVRHQHPDAFAWADYPTVANPTGRGHLERLVGDARVRAAIEAGHEVPEEVFDLAAWSARTAPIALYDLMP